MIRVEGLHKRFGRLVVLDDFSMHAGAGRVTAVVGPNGSGKTTLIKCLLGLVKPDAGSIYIGDMATGSDPLYRSLIGYMPQKPPFPDNLTPREVLDMLKDLRGIRGSADESLVEAFGLDSEMDKPVRSLSGGTRQKVSAAAAFLFPPRLLILDEPTAGLDPVASSQLKDRIRAASSSGAGVLLTSHIMSEIEELADDVVFLLEGRARFRGAVSELKCRTGEDRLERAVATLMQQGRLRMEKAA